MAIDPCRRRPRAAATGAIFCVVAAHLTHTSAALAQTPSAEDVASARVLGVEGVRLAQDGDCHDAIVKLQAAEKLYHAPTTLERLGECQIADGHIVDGTETLNRVARETLPPAAPPPFVAAQQRATRALAAARPRIARLRIHVAGAPTDGAAVAVDGVAVPPALFDSDRPTDPGAHEVTATAAGYRTATTSVRLAEGEAASITLTLEPAPQSPVAAAPAVGAAGAPSAPSPPSSGAHGGPDRVPAIVAFAAGGVGLAVGAVFGAMALSTKSSLDGACPNKVCPSAAQQSDIDALASRSTVSNVGFAVGLVGVAVGTILLVTSGGHDSDAQASTPTWRARIGLGTAGLEGSFQ